MCIEWHIPFLDLVTPHVELEEELTAVFQPALSHRRLHRRPDGRGVREGLCRTSAMPSMRLPSAAAPMRCASR